MIKVVILGGQVLLVGVQVIGKSGAPMFVKGIGAICCLGFQRDGQRLGLRFVLVTLHPLELAVSVTVLDVIDQRGLFLTRWPSTVAQ